MEQSPSNPVATGLTAPQPSEQTQSAPAVAPASDPIKINIPDDLTVKVGEINHPEILARQRTQVSVQEAAQASQSAIKHPPAQDFTRDTQEEAEAENLKRDFVMGVMARRQAAPAPYVPPPPSERVLEQTRLEMEAGKAAIAKAQEAQALRPRPAKDPREGTTKSILRPEDFVPNMNQGQTPANTYRPV